jgi:hypothetical protein
MSEYAVTATVIGVRTAFKASLYLLGIFLNGRGGSPISVSGRKVSFSNMDFCPYDVPSTLSTLTGHRGIESLDAYSVPQ